MKQCLNCRLNALFLVRNFTGRNRPAVVVDRPAAAFSASSVFNGLLIGWWQILRGSFNNC